MRAQSFRSLSRMLLPALAGVLLGLASLGTLAADKLKVVYHLSDYDKVGFVLGNIDNHIRGVGGADKVDIVLVVHGPALKAFEKTQAEPRVLERIAGLRKNKVELDACGNTLKAEQLTLADLPEGFVRVDQGGVVRIAELQYEGYLYIRP